ncbi:Heme oxygenase 2 [Mortierella sp. AM989]|nr:Heme oxygenase 2 [Mortierella sp. AM989]
MALLTTDLKEGAKTIHTEAERSESVCLRQLSRVSVPRFQSYIDAIKLCSSIKPELLIAHCYVRCLGDLSGGQILSSKLQKHNNIPEGKGLDFYTFNRIEDTESFKEGYRKRPNQVEVDEEIYRQTIQESRQAFIRIIDVFQEPDHPVDRSVASKRVTAVLQCPFMAGKDTEALRCHVTEGSHDQEAGCSKRKLQERFYSIVIILAIKPN